MNYTVHSSNCGRRLGVVTADTPSAAIQIAKIKFREPAPIVESTAQVLLREADREAFAEHMTSEWRRGQGKIFVEAWRQMA